MICGLVMAGSTSQSQSCNAADSCHEALCDDEVWGIRTMMNDFLSGFLEELVMEICRRSKVRRGPRPVEIDGGH
jgi:hypothetical protein